MKLRIEEILALGKAGFKPEEIKTGNKVMEFVSEMRKRKTEPLPVKRTKKAGKNKLKGNRGLPHVIKEMVKASKGVTSFDIVDRLEYAGKKVRQSEVSTILLGLSRGVPSIKRKISEKVKGRNNVRVYEYYWEN